MSFMGDPFWLSDCQTPVGSLRIAAAYSAGIRVRLFSSRI